MRREQEKNRFRYREGGWERERGERWDRGEEGEEGKRKEIERKGLWRDEKGGGRRKRMRMEGKGRE